MKPQGLHFKAPFTIYTLNRVLFVEVHTIRPVTVLSSCSPTFHSAANISANTDCVYEIFAGVEYSNCPVRNPNGVTRITFKSH